MFGAMDLGIADDGERASSEQAAQIAIASFADIAELVPTSARVLLGTNPITINGLVILTEPPSHSYSSHTNPRLCRRIDWIGISRPGSGTVVSAAP
jgi:hypothetical protein